MLNQRPERPTQVGKLHLFYVSALRAFGNHQPNSGASRPRQRLCRPIRALDEKCLPLARSSSPGELNEDNHSTIPSLTKASQKCFTALPDTGGDSNQFMNRLTARINEVLRHASQIEDASILGIDPSTLIQRRENFLEGHRSKLRLLAIAIC